MTNTWNAEEEGRVNLILIITQNNHTWVNYVKTMFLITTCYMYDFRLFELRCITKLLAVDYFVCFVHFHLLKTDVYAVVGFRVS